MPDHNFQAAIEEFKKGGWIVAFLGGAGVCVRLLISSQEHDKWFWFQRIVAGTIMGVITYFALYNVEIEQIYKSVILSTSGAFSPEIMKFIEKKIKNGKSSL